MRKIYEWALDQIGATKNGNLIKAINMLNDSVQENFVDVIIGIDIDEFAWPYTSILVWLQTEVTINEESRISADSGVPTAIEHLKPQAKKVVNIFWQ